MLCATGEYLTLPVLRKVVELLPPHRQLQRDGDGDPEAGKSAAVARRPVPPTAAPGGEPPPAVGASPRHQAAGGPGSLARSLLHNGPGAHLNHHAAQVSRRAV